MVSRTCRGSFALAAPLAVALALTVATTAGAGEGAAAPRSRTLADGWRFQPDPLRVGDAQRWQETGFDRSGWRPVEVPAAWDFYAPVLDGTRAGENFTGYLPFEIDLGPHLRRGRRRVQPALERRLSIEVAGRLLARS
jgi:hypothetical protein